MRDSSHDQLHRRVRADRLRIARGERPLYHASWTTVPEGADVRVRELPIIHLFVPDVAGVADGARGLIAGALAVDAASFDLVTEDSSRN